MLHNLLHLAFLGQKTISTLGDDISTPSGLFPEPLRLVQLFDQDFQLVLEVLKHTMTTQDKLFFLSSRLHLYSFVLNSYHSSNTSPETAHPDAEKAEFVTKASLIVVELLQLTQFYEQDQSKVWPAFIKFCVLYATSLGLALAAMPEGLKRGQQNFLVEACRAGNNLIQSWSLFNKDHYSRMSAFLSNLLKYVGRGSSTDAMGREQQHEHANTSMLSSPIQSRMSTNILYNVIWHAKRVHVNSGNLASAPEEQGQGVAASSNDPSTNPGDHDFTQIWTPTYNDFRLMDDFVDPEGFDIFADWQDLLGNST